jgi:MazG family protein
VLLRDPYRHPAALHLERADIPVEPIPDGSLDVRDRRDLLQGAGDPGDRRLASGLCKRAETGVECVVLLGPDDRGLGRAVGLEAARRHIEVEWLFLAELPAGGELLRLVDIERQLRDPDNGCPGDLEQDHESLARYLVEETYEALDAIASGDDREIVEELGDVLLQVVFHAQIGADRRAFTIDDIARGIADKLVHRHPHVFGDTEVADADEVVANWEELKAAEKPERTGPFDGVATSQPAVPLTAKLVSRAAKHHVPQPDGDAAVALVRTRLDALADAEDPTEAYGELLLAVVGLAQVTGVDPELTLRAAADRFRLRVEGFLDLARNRGVDLASADEDTRRALIADARERYG